MRLRHKSWVGEAIRQFDSFVFSRHNPPPNLKGEWVNAFPSPQPLCLEIGTGKGDFITAMAEKYPHLNFIGVEMAESVLYTAAQKTAAKELANVRLLVFDAKNLSDIFAPGEIQSLYINFCDPWPKLRHAKRRLTYSSFLTMYRQILIPNGKLCFKTDNMPLFEFSLEQFRAAGLDIISCTRDLYGEGDAVDNVPTEYEKKFSGRGVKICRAEVIFPKEAKPFVGKEEILDQ